jgi:hypothetical protein
MPVVDLRQWQAHIPGLKNVSGSHITIHSSLTAPQTPWEGGVYSLDVTFWPPASELSESIPKRSSSLIHTIT